MISDAEHLLIMKILGNASRLKILRAIFGSRMDLCVNQIAEIASISQSMASHQLAYLSMHGVVKGHRMGQLTCYVPAKNAITKKVLRVLHVLST